VPLDPQLREALVSLPSHGGGGHVFRFAGDPHSVVERMRRLAKRDGMVITMRTLRRGFGCRYAARVPAQVLQRLMRHSNISITMNYYANVDDAVERAVLGESNSPGNSRPSEAAKPAENLGNGPR
jgi:integrase